MSYATGAGHGVPFAGLVEPTRFVGEAIFDASQAIARVAARGFEAIVKQVRVHTTVNELSTLSDHVLKDIGIDRPEIESLVRRVADNPNIDYRVLRSW